VQRHEILDQSAFAPEERSGNSRSSLDSPLDYFERTRTCLLIRLENLSIESSVVNDNLLGRSNLHRYASILFWHPFT
jgi:hypothetical protein